MEPNSFLVRPANNVPSLVKQCKEEPLVMGRFMRHFGMTQDEVMKLLTSLRPGTLKETGPYLVYNSPDSGEVRSRVMYFKKGMPVWEDADGRPILRTRCGNPMVRGTDLVSQANPVKPGLVGVAAPGQAVSIAMPDSSLMAAETGLTLPPLPESGPMALVSVAPPLVPVGTSNSGLGWLVPVLGGFALGFRGGDTPPIPEPGLMIAATVGLVTMVSRRRSAQKASN
ncbi:MAG: hypothetical protein KIT11_10880 [Fimbriimonadaceae bacterium]|nr:hypothetical protein [Fimbriimonadaceae bacterium]QYK55825.1 MAG: hypothetical protein KF733_12550 [Fimbriimonadaceae bacterium]